MVTTGKFNRALALALAGIVCATSAVEAGGRNRAGGAAASQLLIPVGAREMAVGGSSIASTEGIGALHWNPAGLAGAPTTASLMVSTMSYIADMRLNYAAVGARFAGLGHLAVSIKSLSMGEIPVTTATSPDGTGGTFTPTFFTLGATYANDLTDRIRMGGTLHYISESVGRASASGVSFSGGVQYANLGGVDGVDLGVAIKHIGSRMQYGGPGLLYPGQVDGLRRAGNFYRAETSSADLPSLFEVGLSYEMPITDGQELSLNSLFQHHNYDYDEYRLGAEYNLNDLLVLRAGFDLPAGVESGADDSFIYGTSFGLGLMPRLGSVRDLEIDYAYTSVDYFSAMHTFTVKLGF